MTLIQQVNEYILLIGVGLKVYDKVIISMVSLLVVYPTGIIVYKTQ